MRAVLLLLVGAAVSVIAAPPCIASSDGKELMVAKGETCALSEGQHSFGRLLLHGTLVLEGKDISIDAESNVEVFEDGRICAADDAKEAVSLHVSSRDLIIDGVIDISSHGGANGGVFSAKAGSVKGSGMVEANGGVDGGNGGTIEIKASSSYAFAGKLKVEGAQEGTIKIDSPPMASPGPAAPAAAAPASAPRFAAAWIQSMVAVGAVEAAAAGDAFTCTLNPSGELKCFGDNSRGQLGYGDQETRMVPAARNVPVGGTVTAVVAGKAFVCAVADGGVKCWGDGDHGQLGTGSTGQLKSPPGSAVKLLGTVATVSAGLFHACALLQDKKVQCWGDNIYGQLGLGDTKVRPAPPEQALSIDGTVTAVIAGGDHTCVILSNGQLRCWGRNNFGQLGYGDHSTRQEPPTQAVDVGGWSVLSAAAGVYHTCVVLQNKGAKCWGSGLFGRLGYGDDTYHSSPPTALIDFGEPVVKIAAVRERTCAIGESGALKCWGDNFYGQLGLNHTNNVNAPGVAVPLEGKVSSVVLGFYHTCAILEDKSMKCWGRGEFGAPGYGSDKDIVGVPETLVGIPPSPSPSPTPDPSVFIATGFYTTCARLLNGALKCWGYNAQGQLGTGSYDRLTEPPYSPIALGAQMVTSVSIAFFHTCATLADKTLRCWGYNGYGELGYGDRTQRPEPPNERVALKAGVKQLSVGKYHTCTLLVTDEAFCWGYGGNGQLGYGNRDTLYAPSNTAINMGGTIKYVAAGHYYNCFLLTDGNVKCIGQNYYGMLGYGHRSDIITNPANVQFGGRAIALSVNAEHTCVIMAETYAVRCWGRNFAGQLGLGDTNDRNSPELRDINLGGNKALQVGIGFYHTCVIVESGDLYCFGYNGHGQLGVGDNSNRATPVKVDLGGKTAKSIALGWHTCVVNSDNEVRCWGLNDNGMLGYGDYTNRNRPGDAVLLEGKQQSRFRSTNRQLVLEP